MNNIQKSSYELQELPLLLQITELQGTGKGFTKYKKWIGCNHNYLSPTNKLSF